MCKYRLYFLDLKLQCSVCWEDFTIEEKVMKLTCDHMYHKDCIIPWLELVRFSQVLNVFYLIHY